MAIQPCNLSYDHGGEPCGVALVDTVTGLPLPLSWQAFADIEEAEAFLTWAPFDVRKLTAEAMQFLLANWRTSPRGLRSLSVHHDPDERLSR